MFKNAYQRRPENQSSEETMLPVVENHKSKIAVVRGSYRGERRVVRREKKSKK